MNHLLPIHELVSAHQRILPYISQTPLVSNGYINKLFDGQLFFKCENLQKTGSFKIRGALNATLQLSAALGLRGVATHSSGNHAQALAYAANLLRVPAHIVMPRNSSRSKIAGVEQYGGRITFCDPTLEARESVLKKVVIETGATFVPPYDDDRIICGQSTVAMEVFDGTLHPDNIIVPLGGGGLLSGTGLAVQYFAPTVQVLGAEPATMDDGLRSFERGTLQKNRPGSQSIAEGLRTHLSERTLHYIKQNTTHILTASEASIVEAMQLIWQHLKVIVEPSAAVPLACLLEDKRPFRHQQTVVILSGGNVDWAGVPFLSGSAAHQ